MLGPRRRRAVLGASPRVASACVHGESLAVIGPNGAGKSTLLQVLAGIIRPSEGSVEVSGHVSGLLTLGAGFDRDLTGRDNILLGGAFLGLDDDVTRELLPSIVEYADLGQFIDAPLKTYSSGMRARLGFAIATSVDPDILLLDEVLATGDAEFRDEVQGAGHRARQGGQGRRARDPRHGLGQGVLQPRDAHREGPGDRRRASRPRSSRSTGSTPRRRARAGSRPPRPPAWTPDRQTLRAPSGTTGPLRSTSESSSGT